MNQHTIRFPVSIQGIGLHTGEYCTVKIAPSLPDSGITFYLNGGSRRIFPSDIYSIINPVLSTNIGDTSASISTIEHLMACLHALQIDNVDITVSGNEIPILDGSGRPFYRLLKSAEIIPQSAERKFIKVQEPKCIDTNGSYIYAEPCDTLHIRMRIDFDHPLIGVQETEFKMYSRYFGMPWEDCFKNIIAPARTFGFISQIEQAMKQGLIKGGSLDSAIVLDDKQIFNPPLRMDDEFVHHKLLDFLGDIYVAGPILGFFDVCCTSHKLNNQLVRSILEEICLS